MHPEYCTKIVALKTSNFIFLQLLRNLSKNTAGAGTQIVTVDLQKENNTFGFSINQDAQGFFIQMLAPDGPAEKAGISVGDRVIGIEDREDFDEIDFEGIVEIIKSSKSVKMSILTQQNKMEGGRKDLKEAPTEDDAVFKTLRGEEKIDYVVQKRFLQQKLEEKAKRGTDMRKKTKINKDLADAEGPEDENEGEEKDEKKKKKSKKGISFGVTEVAEIGEDGQVVKMGEMETKKAKRKKKKKDGTMASTSLDGSSDKKKLTMAEYSKAMRKKTLEVNKSRF